MTPLQDNALAALERARQAQERHERRIDVQLRLEVVREGNGRLQLPKEAGTLAEVVNAALPLSQSLEP